ncbi:rhodanese-like domain-containing protein [uncultured Lentibacter sp.]|jgi:rhodanese-related sulfurtransferase|uniref:rhodanese-like domain-containing protein n=1 Tax=uncultured Lentibacter sp. TaxID=1659309 RepID=UPI00260A319B|nr:rhodanese-like domain-containing protein [uncultured Lentibacter sp.]
MKRLFGLYVACAVFLPAAVFAQDVRITPELSSKTITLTTGETLVIERIQDTAHRLDSEFTKTSRACPPFCISPISAAPGIETFGEIEVLSFMENSLATGRGLLLDSRMPEWFAKGTIPGAVNVPFATLDETNPYRDEILKALGARQTGDSWDFTTAKELLLFCNGPWCDQSPRAIKSLRSVGYPADKLKFYRGGMQLWMLLGLTVRQPT